MILELAATAAIGPAAGMAIYSAHRQRKACREALSHLDSQMTQREQVAVEKARVASIPTLERELLPRYGSGTVAAWVRAAERATTIGRLPCECLDCEPPFAPGWEHHECELAPPPPSPAPRPVAARRDYYEKMTDSVTQAFAVPPHVIKRPSRIRAWSERKLEEDISAHAQAISDLSKAMHDTGKAIHDTGTEGVEMVKRMAALAGSTPDLVTVDTDGNIREHYYRHGYESCSEACSCGTPTPHRPGY